MLVRCRTRQTIQEEPIVSTSALVALAALAGLVLGSVVVYLTPRLVAYRLETPPETPGPGVLIPLAGARVATTRPLRAAVIEIVTAAVFAAVALDFGNSVRTPIACGYALLLIAIAVVDLEHRLVLNRLSYPGVAVALAASFFWPGQGIGSAALGGVTAFVLFFVIELIGRGAMGPGDTKLATLIGVMRGFPDLFNALLLGVLLGGAAALFYLVVLRRSRKEKFAYGPYLAAGAIASLFLQHVGLQ
jgi:prepilin signal peptidase PulO-like enzyme (type II secretory pathway)